MAARASAPDEETGVRASQSSAVGSETALWLDETSASVTLAEVPAVRDEGTIASRAVVVWVSPASAARSVRKAWSEGFATGGRPAFRLPIKPMGRPILRAKRLIGSVIMVLFSN
jgi:hypothetical protein